MYNFVRIDWIPENASITSFADEQIHGAALLSFGSDGSQTIYAFARRMHGSIVFKQ